ncbi:hypothetical protein PHYBOEH_001726 [Phytophthora boehmeriae]|uniref:Uncharacterized protein n=1 Tax=Phytophthora boehmeriae TaxID=109152 RepID=A0A8T1XD41_9STRA|nr:hypothetical protein PHYBOEH_001726 [Phytophthora boehmeriae]
MDAVDVIVLDDSDSSSENASASTTPAASPAMKSNQPSTGYQNAVEAALAMAAAYETTDSKKEKKKKGPLKWHHRVLCSEKESE